MLDARWAPYMPNTYSTYKQENVKWDTDSDTDDSDDEDDLKV